MHQSISKKYGLPTAMAMVVGIVIGSGIFFKAEKILNATGGNLRIGILAWVIGGIIAVISACAFAVIATRFPHAQGVVDYAEATVGPRYAYLLGWMMTLTYFPAMTGCLAWVSARYTSVLLGWDSTGGSCMTLTMVYLCGIYFISAVAPKLAGKLQISLTIIKLIPILLMAIIGTAVGLQSGMTAQNFAIVTTDIVVKNPLFSAVAATVFAFEGWIIATTISGELKNTKRNLPIALVGGVSAVAIIYLLYYVGIAGAIPNSVMMESGQTGAKLAYSAIFGEMGGTLLFVFVVLSCLGTCNGLMMGCTRGLYALAVHGRGPVPSLMSNLDPHTGMPNNSAAFGLLASALWAAYFYYGTLSHMLGPFRFDSSEVPIISLYAAYIPVSIGFMRMAKEEGFFRRFVIPTLAIGGSLVMVYAAIMSYHEDVFYFLLVLAIVMAIGMVFAPQKKLVSYRSVLENDT